MSRPATCSILRLVFLGSVALGLAEGREATAHPSADAGSPSLHAARISQDITVDGRLEEPAWRDAEVSAGFVQREPNPSAAASETTEVRVLFSDFALYVGITAFDSDPSRIVAREMGRDVELSRDDSITLLLDTFHNHQSAYLFATNPLGSLNDGLVDEEGGDVNRAWDGVWTVGTKHTDQGWTAEFEIPFATLRFDPSTERWGFNVRRLIRRKEEEVFWAPIGLDADLYRLSQAGHLSGIAGLPRSRGLDVLPFLSASQGRRSGPHAARTREDAEIGVDVKWAPSPRLSLDLTVNTDFAEAEVDEQRVNLTQFSLFFPEQRDFFLENAGIFEFGPSLISGDDPLFKPFFSRRIGIAEDGSEVPLEWGLRLAGRSGPWDLGILTAQTGGLDRESGSLPTTSWGVARLRRNIGRRSNVGLLTTHLSSRDRRNTLLGIDAEFPFTDHWRIWTFAVASDDSTLGSDWAGGFGLNRTTSHWHWGASVIQIGGDFEPAAGFLQRRQYRRYSSGFEWSPRPTSFESVRNFAFGAGGTIFVDPTTGRTTSIATGANPLVIRFSSGDFLTTFFEHRFERLEEGFALHPTVFLPAGDYRWNEYGLLFESSDRRPISGSTLVIGGQLFGGDRLTTRLSLAWRPSARLRTETTWNRDRVDLEFGSFATDVLRQRLRFALTPRLFIGALLQDLDISDLSSVNLRLEWLYRPGSELFLVFNEARQDQPGAIPLRTTDRQIIVKMSYLLRL